VYYRLSRAQKLLRSDFWTTGDRTIAFLLAGIFLRKNEPSTAIVENAFGQFKERFGRIGKGFNNHITRSNNLILCCCILHIFLNESNSDIQSRWTMELGEVRSQPEHVVEMGNRNRKAEAIRQVHFNVRAQTTR